MTDTPDGPQDKARSNINLRVTEEERWAFKAWCAEHRISQVDAFREAFDLLKAARTGPKNEAPLDALKLIQSASSFTMDRERDLRIERRGQDAWAVCVGAGVVNIALRREPEPLPSSRDEDFIARTRFALPDALRLAEDWLIEEQQRQSITISQNS